MRSYRRQEGPSPGALRGSTALGHLGFGLPAETINAGFKPPSAAPLTEPPWAKRCCALPPTPHLLRGRQHGTPLADTEWALRRRAAGRSLALGLPTAAGAGGGRPSTDGTGWGSMGYEATRPCPAVLQPGTQLAGVGHRGHRPIPLAQPLQCPVGVQKWCPSTRPHRRRTEPAQRGRPCTSGAAGRGGARRPAHRRTGPRPGRRGCEVRPGTSRKHAEASNPATDGTLPHAGLPRTRPLLASGAPPAPPLEGKPL